MSHFKGFMSKDLFHTHQFRALTTVNDWLSAALQLANNIQNGHYSMIRQET